MKKQKKSTSKTKNVNDHTKTDYFSHPVNPDIDSIAREVSELAGSSMLNEQLEEHYKLRHSISPDMKPTRIKSSKDKKTAVPTANANITITKKSELRKEMTIGCNDSESDSKMTFCKRNRNALLNSLMKKKEDDRSNILDEYPEKDAEAASSKEEQNDQPASSAQWCKKEVEDSFSEDDFQSTNETLITTEGSTSYVTASESENEVLKGP